MANPAQQPPVKGFMGRVLAGGELVIPLTFVVVVIVMIIPLPTVMLDLLLTVNIAVSGAVYTISQQVIEPSGQPVRSTSVIHVDGEEQPPEGSGVSVVAKRIASRVIEVTATKDGLVVGRGSYEVSRDGTSLTVSTKNASANTARSVT